ncbi:MAG: hypothetical protein IBJ03_02425 [Gemmatimonadaceae bacterium]|nr:hypothetical protein [Gemmatimonadaceae bacterium]
MKDAITMSGTGLPLVEIDKACEVCSAQGTVGRVVRFEEDGSVLDMIRLCEACWPEHSARYTARWDEEHRVAMDAWARASVRESFRDARGANAIVAAPPSRNITLESATWHGTLKLVNDTLLEYRRRCSAGDDTMREKVRELAKAIAAYAPFRVGDMPFAIENLLREYAN